MYPRETIAKVGLWQVSKSEEDWADVIIDQLLGYREHDIMPTATDVMHILKQNMEYVNDDAPLLGIAIDATKGKPIGSIALVSTDNKLGRRVAARTGHHVLLVHPESVINKFDHANRVWSADNLLSEDETEQLLGLIDPGRWAPRPRILLLDSGSFATYAMRMEKGENGHGLSSGTIFKTESHQMEIIDGKRTHRYTSQKVNRMRPFTVVLIAANGSIRKVQIDPQGGRPDNPQRRSSTFSRFMPKKLW
jgi:hypothetical protein